uniref:Uncharacterized protein n=1 Tax=Knipowitschia caucasica TaxID=637954 RepID=A0AAV2KX91_KNICA
MTLSPLRQPQGVLCLCSPIPIVHLTNVHSSLMGKAALWSVWALQLLSIRCCVHCPDPWPELTVGIGCAAFKVLPSALPPPQQTGPSVPA